MNDWREVTLESLCALVSSGGTPARSEPSFYTRAPDGHRWVKSQELRDGSVWDTQERISDLGLAKSSAKLYPPETVLVAMYGATVGMLGYLRVEAAVNQAICGLVIDRNTADPRFVYYALREARPDLVAGAAGAAQQNLNQGQIRAFRMRVPGPSTQRHVGAILGAVDDLIENSRRRIALLEQMARAIYQEWFVHFRYPGHENDEFVGSPLGPIPEGWSVSTLGDQLRVLESGSRPRGGIDPNERGVPSVGAENILGPGRYRFEAEKYVSESFYDSMRRGRVEDGDVLLYKDGAHIGRHSLFRDGFPHSRCVINEHVFRMQARPPLSQSYLYFWIDRPETVEDIVSLNSNAAQPGLSQAKVATLAVMVPSVRVLKSWDEAVEPLIKLLFGLAKQSRCLVQTRDLLLPGLVSGAIDVSRLDLDALVEESAA